MKMVLAIIQPTRLSTLQQALAKVGVERMTICDAQGFGRQKGRTEKYRGVEYKLSLIRKVAVEIVVNDDFLDRTIEVIEQAAKTSVEGNIGDGKVFILPVADTYQIGGPEVGPEAV